MNTSAIPTWSQRFAPLVRGFHRYAAWLVSISWKRFFLLALLLMILASILQNVPPFSWTMREVIEEREAPHAPPKPPRPPADEESRSSENGRSAPVIRIEKGGEDGENKAINIVIDKRGVLVQSRPATAESAASAAAGAASAGKAPADKASAASAVSATTPAATASKPGAKTPREIRVEVQRDGSGQDQASIRVVLPEGEGLDSAAIKAAIEEAKQAVKEAMREPAIEAVEGPPAQRSGPTVRVSRVYMEDALTDLALLWILASIIIKLTYKGQLQAREQAAQATEMAEAESLKRQLAEARMATMQAQVEPHFLFNTLASIEHLIETDPPRASRMQRALIDLLRATMPTLRDGGGTTTRTLGQEQAVIEPYLAILKIRMEDRLEPEVRVPDGLRSAECPPMVLQMLVENAIKHGLEPKPEGGQLRVEAAIVDGSLMLTVEDTGAGLAAHWEQAATPGQRTGLRNIRERLALRYGEAAQLDVQPREGGGTRVTVRLPYRVVSGTPNDGAGPASSAPSRFNTNPQGASA